jgi:hypothetical protein
MPAITGTVLVNLGKQLLKNMAKKAVKATAKKAVKSVVKKKKVKGKDVAKKMFGGEEKGGALALAPKADLVPSVGGDLVKPKETGGEIVKVSGTAAKDLGLNSFMESLSKIQTNVDAIKVAINDNNKDTIDRIEDQRILNAKLAKEAREDELESKGGGIGKKLLKPIKDPADDFLTRMAKFATMTLLGTLIVALMNGSRDIILAFRIGIEAIKKGLPTLLKGVKALKSGIGKAFKLALRPFKSLGNLIFKGFKALGNKVFGMVKGAMGLIDDALKAIIRAGANAFPRVASVATKVTQTAGKLINQGKEVVRNTIKNVGSKAKNVIKNVGGKASKFITKLFGKQAGKAAGSTVVKSMFKTLGKAAKGIKIPVVGPLLVALMSMFAGDPMKQTLFKTAGAAIGGGLGLALGPIGMIVGEIAGEFVGDVLYEGFNGKDGWAGAGKKLKDKFFQIVKGGKVVLDWVAGGFGRFFKNFMEEHKIPIPKGKGVQTILGKILPFLANKDGLVTSIPNILQLYNPFAMGPLLVKSFFPPGEKKAETVSTTATIGDNGSSSDAEDVSESASYEDGADDTTVVVDGGGDQQSSSSSKGGEDKVTTLTISKQTILNSQYEMVSNAALYKV